MVTEIVTAANYSTRTVTNHVAVPSTFDLCVQKYIYLYTICEQTSFIALLKYLVIFKKNGHKLEFNPCMGFFS